MMPVNPAPRNSLLCVSLVDVRDTLLRGGCAPRLAPDVVISIAENVHQSRRTPLLVRSQYLTNLTSRARMCNTKMLI